MSAAAHPASPSTTTNGESLLRVCSPRTLRDDGLLMDGRNASQRLQHNRPWLAHKHWHEWSIGLLRHFVAEHLGIYVPEAGWIAAALIDAECHKRGLVEPHLYLHRSQGRKPVPVSMRSQMARMRAAMGFPDFPDQEYAPPLPLPHAPPYALHEQTAAKRRARLASGAPHADEKQPATAAPSRRNPPRPRPRLRDMPPLYRPSYALIRLLKAMSPITPLSASVNWLGGKIERRVERLDDSSSLPLTLILLRETGRWLISPPERPSASTASGAQASPASPSASSAGRGSSPEKQALSPVPQGLCCAQAAARHFRSHNERLEAILRGEAFPPVPPQAPGQNAHSCSDSSAVLPADSAKGSARKGGRP